MKTILVATDFSAPAQNALNYAIRLCEQFQAKLIILNVFSPSVAGLDAVPALDTLTQAELSSEMAMSDLKKTIELNNNLKEIQCLSRMGNLNDLVAEISTHYHIDAIVMGITGSAGKIKEKVIGSNTLDIARESSLPLFIIPEETEFKTIKNMAFACDIDNLMGSRVLEHVKEIGSLFNASLEIVNVAKPGEEEEPLRMRNFRFMESVFAGTKHSTTVLSNSNPHEALQEYFTKNQPDVMLLNPKKQNFVSALFHKSMTKTMMFHIKVPMLIVH